MPSTLKLDITESLEELKELLKHQSSIAKRERIHALYLLKIGLVTSVRDVALALARDRVTIQRWLKIYRNHGVDGLLEERHSTGRKPAIPDIVQAELIQELQTPDRFRSYSEIQTWLKETHQLTVSYKVIYDTIHNRLKINLKDSLE